MKLRNKNVNSTGETTGVGQLCTSRDNCTPQFKCLYCDDVFDTKIGRGVHCNSKHKAQRNVELGELHKRTESWTSEDTARLAKAEAMVLIENPKTRNINQVLLNLSVVGECNLDKLKYRRNKTRGYRELVEKFKAELLADSNSVLVQPVAVEGRTGPSATGLALNADSALDTSHQDEIQDSLAGIRDFLRNAVRPESSDIGVSLNEIIERALNGVDYTDLLDSLLLKFFSNESALKAHERVNVQTKVLSKREERKKLFVNVQKLYTKNKSKCIQKILDGLSFTDTQVPAIDNEGLINFWKKVFYSQHQVTVSAERKVEVVNQLVDPISLDELTEAKLKDCSPGPDGLMAKDIAQMDKNVLLIIMNLFLLSGKATSYMKRSKTILIPKGDDPAGPGDYRPITLTPMLLRLFHKIIYKRVVKYVSFDNKQHAFLPVDGCTEAVMLYSACMSEARFYRKELHSVSIDLKKAFDSVSMSALKAALFSHGWPDHLIGYVMDYYRFNDIHLALGNGSQVRIESNQGVRQGDPLSPILFNLVVDDLLKSLPSEIGYKLSSGESVNCIAFADDIIFLSQTARGMTDLLSTAEKFFSARGLSVQPAKCSSLSLLPHGRLKRVEVGTSSRFKIAGEGIPAIGVSSHVKYLGIPFTPTGRLSPSYALNLWLERVRKAPLKPQQRLTVVRQFLIPRMLHGLTFGRFNSGSLNQLDLTIRNEVRSWLHLPHDFPVAAFYASVGDGGLGIPNLRHLIPRVKVKRIENLGKRESSAFILSLPTVRAEVNRAEKLCKKGFNIIKSSSDVSHAFRLDLLERVDGKGLAEANKVPSVHKWLLSDNGFIRGRDFVDMVKCRYNALPTRSRSARNQPSKTKQCRTPGCFDKETLAHVSQLCHSVHGMRIKRHDNIGRTLLRELKSSGFKVEWEPRFKTSNGIRKPDIIARKGDKTYVVDIQVVGDGRNLRGRHLEKVRKYGSDKDIVRQLGSAVFSSLTITYKGVWSRESAETLRQMGVRERIMDLITVQAIQGTLNLWRVFNSLAGFSVRGGGSRG